MRMRRYKVKVEGKNFLMSHSCESNNSKDFSMDLCFRGDEKVNRIFIRFKRLLTYFFAALVYITPDLAFALEDDLLKAIEIGSSGAKVQMDRLKVAAENIANEDTTGTQPGEKPYQRKVLFVENRYDPKLKTNVVKIKKYSVDNSDFIKRYDPHHPAADQEGYVLYPNVYKEIEKADSIEAKNSFEANLSVIEISKAMLQRTIEVMR